MISNHTPIADRVATSLARQGLMQHLGTRLLANVDAPDIDVFATRYAARTLRFKAGSGLKLGGVANYLLACAIRVGLVRDPAAWAVRLHRWGTRFERFGDGKSAMYLDVSGVDPQGQPLQMHAQLTALNKYPPMNQSPLKQQS